MVIVGALAGAIWAFIPGLLKAKFNVNEVVSSIMMNWTCLLDSILCSTSLF